MKGKSKEGSVWWTSVRDAWVRERRRGRGEKGSDASSPG